MPTQVGVEVALVGWPHFEKIGRYGVVLGSVRGEVLRYYGQGHLLVVAGTQTGKTVTVKSTLLEVPYSVIVNDTKDELYADAQREDSTAGWRSTMSKIVRLAPLEASTDQHNPWACVRLGTDDEIRDVDVITEYLTNPNGTEPKDDTTKHFNTLVKLVFRGISLYGLHSGAATTGAEFNDLVHLPGDVTADEDATVWEQLLTVMKAFDHPAVQRAVEVAGRPGDRELGSLQTTIANALDMFADPRVAHFTNASSFALTDLREAARPCSVYYTVPFADQRRLLGLTRLVLQQLFDYCTSRKHGWRHRMLVILDEFPSLKRFDAISDGLNFWAGYGMQALIITPSMEELIDVYGTHHNFFEGCRVQLVFGQNDEKTAKGFAERIGHHTVSQERVSTSHGRKTTTTDERKEALIDTTGILKIPEDQLLIKAGRYATLAQQARYYQHRLWRDRSRCPLPQRTVIHVP